MAPDDFSMTSPPPISGIKVVATAVCLLAWPALVLFLSGDWHWVAGWIFGIWFVALFATTVGWLYFHDPALLAERYRRPGSGGQPWSDTLIVVGLTVGFVIWIVLPPLDVRRYHWTPGLSLRPQIFGGLLLIGSFFFFVRSFTDNTFLSPLVRIQSERKQRVVSTGVYGVVRHPMYLGASLMFVGGPMLLASAIGLVVGVWLVLLLMMRIVGEEDLLARELEGYEAYCERVRYRLVPYFW